MDISSSIGQLLAIKDSEELGLIRKACEITGKLYSKHLKDQIINIVASERVRTRFFNVDKTTFELSLESQTFEIIRRS